MTDNWGIFCNGVDANSLPSLSLWTILITFLFGVRVLFFLHFIKIGQEYHIAKFTVNFSDCNAT